MQDEIRDERLLERRRKALDELRREPPDEADRVGDEVSLALVLEDPRRRVEGLEEAVLDRDLRTGEGVQQRRLADVRVAGECDRRSRGQRACLATGRAMAADVDEAALELRDAAVREPPVGLELRLTRPSRADAAAHARGAAAACLPLEVLPHAPHAREVVLELRELDLELALGRDGVLREDVEDQLRPVDYPR